MIAPTFMKFAIKQESRLVNKLLQNNNYNYKMYYEYIMNMPNNTYAGNTLIAMDAA